MDFIDRIKILSKKIGTLGIIETEEATKNALVMPFLHTVLGYDVFDPAEVVPEFTADVATKKGEKVDYALKQDGEVKILIECKKLGENLCLKHAGQLFRYFSVTNARIAVLTDGRIYQFYTDLDAPNKMDEKPFLILDLLDIDEHIVGELKKLTKQSFDIDSVMDSAGELKYLNEVKKIVAAQFEEPDEDFVRLFASRVHSGPITSKVREQFFTITKKALRMFLRDSINLRLSSALNSEVENGVALIEIDQPEQEFSCEAKEESKIVTTEEEIEGFNVVRAILREVVPVKRIYPRDTQSYFGVLLDDNNRKPLCRLHFNSKQKYLGVFDKDKNETRVSIETVDDIFSHAALIIQTAQNYIVE